MLPPFILPPLLSLLLLTQRPSILSWQCICSTRWQPRGLGATFQRPGRATAPIDEGGGWFIFSCSSLVGSPSPGANRWRRVIHDNGTMKERRCSRGGCLGYKKTSSWNSDVPKQLIRRLKTTIVWTKGSVLGFIVTEWVAQSGRVRRWWWGEGEPKISSSSSSLKRPARIGHL